MALTAVRVCLYCRRSFRGWNARMKYCSSQCRRSYNDVKRPPRNTRARLKPERAQP
jgi:hypothetical protein